jgi:hypothetical protein
MDPNSEASITQATNGLYSTNEPIAHEPQSSPSAKDNSKAMFPRNIFKKAIGSSSPVKYVNHDPLVIPNSITKPSRGNSDNYGVTSLNGELQGMGLLDFFKGKRIFLHGQSKSFVSAWLTIGRAFNASSVQRLNNRPPIFDSKIDRIICEMNPRQSVSERTKFISCSKIILKAIETGVKVTTSEKVITAILEAQLRGYLPIP